MSPTLLEAPRGKRGFGRQVPLQLTEEEVVAAVQSLYSDHLKPYGRILLRRIGELASSRSGGGQPPFINTKDLRDVCERSRRLSLQAEEASEYSVALRGECPSFVDPNDPNDPYPSELWESLRSYFAEGGAGHDSGLPGGRYACARALAGLGLACLAGRSLGELSHVVALAIGQRRVLGYRDGQTVPFQRSEAGIKELHAAHAMPIANPKGASTDTMGVAGWDAVRAGLWELLCRAEEQADTPGKACIPLPNVKRLFRSDLKLELSETFLGHSRLQDLLQDARLSDICALHRRQGVHMVEKVAGAPLVAQPSTFHLLSTAPPPTTPSPSTPPSVRTTFAALPVTSAGGSALDSSGRGEGFYSGPWALPDSRETIWQASVPAIDGSQWAVPVPIEEFLRHGPVEAAPGGENSSDRLWTVPVEEFFGHGCAGDVALQEKFQESPWDLARESGGEGWWPAAASQPAYADQAQDSLRTMPQQEFLRHKLKDSPRALGDATADSASDSSTLCDRDSSSSSHFGSLLNMEVEVLNTFIHIEVPEDSPVSASRRRKSLPHCLRLA
jgi:hypothetical protein